jgi:hypothetical protein
MTAVIHCKAIITILYIKQWNFKSAFIKFQAEAVLLQSFIRQGNLINICGNVFKRAGFPCLLK